MKSFRGIWTLVSALSFAACTAPVNRSTPAPQAAPVEVKQDDPADLKKRIFLLSFRENPDPPSSLKEVKIGRLMSKKLSEVFGNEKSPYIPQTPQDEQAYGVADLDSTKDVPTIVKSLRGSDIAGFLRGDVVQLDTADTGGDTEGFLKTKTLKFTLGVNYEMYDTTTGRKIASGSDQETYTETRSDMFGTPFAIPELDKKVGEMTAALARKIYKRMEPFAQKLAWTGRVLRIDGTRIYLNSGRRTGILVGDVLKVIERPREIVDPQSGDFVGEAPGRVKGTVKVIQYFGSDGAVAVLQSGGGIFPGDRVELF